MLWYKSIHKSSIIHLLWKVRLNGEAIFQQKYPYHWQIIPIDPESTDAFNQVIG